MAEILLEPLDGGDTVPIPDEKTTIGRGPFLQIQDKRVSRNHATLEIKDGKLVLIPTHTNPCYHKIKGEGSQISLPKDKPLTLNHSDVFALLPDKLAYKVIYKSQSQSANGKKEDEKDECSDTEEENSEEEEKANHKNKSSKPTPVALVKNNAADEEDMAMPLEKKRELPKWMVGSSKRVDVSPTGEKSPTKTKAENASPAKDNASKPSPRGRGRPKGTAMASDDEFAGLSDDEKPKRKAVKSRQPARAKGRRSYQEISDEDYEDDFSEEEIKPKPRGGRGRGRGRGRSRKADVDSDEEEESEEEEDSTPAKKPARRPRAASLKSPGYNDDYVLSDEEFFRDDSEEEYSARKKSKGDSDSDFVPDDESDEDWGVKKKSKQSPVPPRGGRGRGRGRGRGSSPKGRRGGRPPLIRTSSQKRRRYSDDDDFEEEDEDYTPRPSKRRAAATKKRYKDRDNSEESEEEDEDISEEEPPPKRTTPNKRGRKPAAAKAAAKESEEEEEEEEEEEDESKKRGRRACMFGKKCYRKNPEHFKEFCHPGDESYEEPDEEEKMALKKTRRGRPKRAANTGKKSLHDGASDDDGEPNTYDRTGSFLDDGTIEDEGEDSSPFDPADDDSDFEPEEEDIARLKREAKGFLKNKKMAKPARSK